MAGHCCSAPKTGIDDTLAGRRYRKALWVALIINAGMFIIELSAGFGANSVSLLADAIDFFGDAANYLVSLVVLSMGLAWRARVAWLKGLTMVIFGVGVLSHAVWSFFYGQTPEAMVMTGIGFLALIANVVVAYMLYRFRNGDSDMRSVWLCSRNDAIGNVAVILAALGVFGTGAAWPDLIVASIMAVLALHSGVSILRHAKQDIQSGESQADAHGHHHSH